MKCTVHKWFMVWDFEKEEQWLNEMSAKGLQFTHVSLATFTFEEGTPGEYAYHLEWLRHGATHAESVAYIRFLEETGVEHVASFKRWAYFRKKTADGPFELFSDLDSRIEHFRRLMTLMYFLFAVWLWGAVYEITLMYDKPGLLPLFIGVMAYFAALLVLLAAGYVKISRAHRKLKNERRLRE